MAKKKVSKKTVTKKTAAKKKGTKAATEPAEGEKRGRTKASELPQEERDARAHELIDSLYTSELEGEERQIEGRKTRSKLRTIDKNWRETYADYIEENYPSDQGEEE